MLTVRLRTGNMAFLQWPNLWAYGFLLLLLPTSLLSPLPPLSYLESERSILTFASSHDTNITAVSPWKRCMPKKEKNLICLLPSKGEINLLHLKNLRELGGGRVLCGTVWLPTFWFPLPSSFPLQIQTPHKAQLKCHLLQEALLVTSSLPGALSKL